MIITVANAEDLWLSCIMHAPAYADHSLVTEEHLSPRARKVLGAIKAQAGQGYTLIQPDQLGLDEAALCSIPRRWGTIDAATTITEAEQLLIESWCTVQTEAVYKRCAEITRTDGRERAALYHADAIAKLGANASGIHWETPFEVAEGFLLAEERKLYGEGPPPIVTMFERLDDMVGNWAPKHETVIAGYTNDGKSTLAVTLLTGMALRDTPCAYLSLEDESKIPVKRQMTIVEEDLAVVARLASRRLTADDIRVLRRLAHDHMRGWPFKLVHAIGWGIERVCFAIQDAVRRFGCKVVCVDYLQAFQTTGDRRQQLGQYAARMKAAAAHVGAHLILVSQIVRPSEGNARLARPNMFMLKESGDIENGAENVVLAWRMQKGMDVAFEDARLILDKSKDGGTGEIPVSWDTTRHYFCRTAPNQPWSPPAARGR